MKKTFDCFRNAPTSLLTVHTFAGSGILRIVKDKCAIVYNLNLFEVLINFEIIIIHTLGKVCHAPA